MRISAGVTAFVLAIGSVAAGNVVADQTVVDVAALRAEADRLADTVEPEVIANRRYLHQHPELSNREVETGKYLAKHLKDLGLEVQTGIAGSGVVAVLRGGKPGPVVALRSDMDALPVTEDVDLPFRSTVKTTYDGQTVGVMHACGHDAHMGILLGVAHILVQMKAQLPGTVKFIFQPAEEGAPRGEEGGAMLMIKQGVLSSDPKPEVIFGLHVLTQFETGTLGYKAGALWASADDMEIVVHGKGSHGAFPWRGVDPIVVASQIVLGLQTITSRQMDITKAPEVITIGKIEGGTRHNIIPDSVTMKGTIRALDNDMRQDLHERITRTAKDIADSAGATADVQIGAETAYPVTLNDPQLTARMLPTLKRVAGTGLFEAQPQLGAEDFSFFAQKIPGLYVFIGIRPVGASMDEYASNHSPRFKVDEAALKLGVRTLTQETIDYLSGSTR
jgi:amidohydrolase